MQEEGLSGRILRHQVNSDALLAGLAMLGLRPLPDAGHRLPMLKVSRYPAGSSTRWSVATVEHLWHGNRRRIRISPRTGVAHRPHGRIANKPMF